LFAKHCWIAEEAQGRAASFVGGHPGCNVLGDLAFEVEAEFIV
jgi:hypothetical protein